MNKNEYFKNAVYALVRESLVGEEGFSFSSPFGDAEIHLGLCRDTRAIVARVTSKRIVINFLLDDGEVEKNLQGFFRILLDEDNPQLEHFSNPVEQEALESIGLADAAVVMLAAGFAEIYPAKEGITL